MMSDDKKILGFGFMSLTRCGLVGALLLLAGCPVSGGGGDDDDAADDDDTTAADDDDTTAGDDDDTTPPGDTFTDCDGIAWDNEDCVDFWGIPCLDGVGDGLCDDGSEGGAPNFNCPEFNFDEGDCAGGDDDDDDATCADADTAANTACGFPSGEDYFCSQEDAWQYGNPDYDCLVGYFEQGCPDGFGDDPDYRGCFPDGTWGD